MKMLVVRAMCCGVLSSIAFAALALALAWFAEPVGSLVIRLYVLAGVPLAFLLEQFQSYQSLQWRLFPEGGAGPALTFLLVEAFVSWAFFFSVAWWLRLRARATSSWESLKPALPRSPDPFTR